MNKLIIDNYEINTPLIEILKRVKSELFNNKLGNIKTKQDSIMVTCPFHKDGLEKKPSCGIYVGDRKDIEYGRYHCFTCSESGPFYKFIAACFDESTTFAKNWLIRNYGTLIEQKPNINLEKIDLFNKKPVKSDYYLNEKILDTFQNYHPYMAQRKLTKDVIEKFKIKYDDKTKCIVFPVWDEKNNLKLLTRRSVIDKRFIIDKDIDKPVYLLNYIKNNNLKTMIICESQINALTCWGYGFPAVALFGTGTKTQYELINKSGVRNIILMLDGDEAGRKGTQKLIENIRKDIIVIDIKMPLNKDVNDLNYDEFMKILNGNVALFNKTLYNVREDININ